MRSSWRLRKSTESRGRFRLRTFPRLGLAAAIAAAGPRRGQRL